MRNRLNFRVRKKLESKLGVVDAKKFRQFRDHVCSKNSFILTNGFFRHGLCLVCEHPHNFSCMFVHDLHLPHVHSLPWMCSVPP